jgi:hypothetical protein
MKEIILKDNNIVIVDDGDFELVNRYKWYIQKSNNTNYARGTVNGKLIYMHKLISRTNSRQKIDHADRNGLNNTRDNLRIADSSQNGINSSKHIKDTTSSRYKGVSFSKLTGKWTAAICLNGKKRMIGIFNDEQKAAKEYDSVALWYFGIFAYLNFPNIAISKSIRPLRVKTSKFKGVSWSNAKNIWQAGIKINGKYKFLGLFTNEIEAAKMHDGIILSLGQDRSKCNFPDTAILIPIPPTRIKTSEYNGVSFHLKSQKWNSKIQYQGKARHVGSFDSEILAINSLSETYSFMADYGY